MTYTARELRDLTHSQLDPLDWLTPDAVVAIPDRERSDAPREQVEKAYKRGRTKKMRPSATTDCDQFAIQMNADIIWRQYKVARDEPQWAAGVVYRSSADGVPGHHLCWAVIDGIWHLVEGMVTFGIYLPWPRPVHKGHRIQA